MSGSAIIDEIELLRCSLLNDEFLSFIDDEDSRWADIFESDAQNYADIKDRIPATNARIALKLNDARVWFEIDFPRNYPEGCSAEIYVKGNINHTEQERWQELIEIKRSELEGTEFPVYQLMSLHILPLVHESMEDQTAPAEEISKESENSEPVYHAIFTSHHLISPNKRRSLQKWAINLSIYGFAKVGYPGVIYCEGPKSNVQEFVSNVKGMQWLALRLRFIEPLAETHSPISKMKESPFSNCHWLEVEKVGKVVDIMQQMQRENFVTQIGLGTSGND